MHIPPCITSEVNGHRSLALLVVPQGGLRESLPSTRAMSSGVSPVLQSLDSWCGYQLRSKSLAGGSRHFRGTADLRILMIQVLYHLVLQI